MRLPLFVAGLRLILHVRVDCMCVLFSCVLFLCACMFEFRVTRHAFACVCCDVVFHITRACILRVVVCFRVFGLIVYDCMLVLRLTEHAFAFVYCKVSFQITRVCTLQLFFCVYVFELDCA